MNSLGVLCCIERCSAKSSVTQLGSPPGCDAQIGQTCQTQPQDIINIFLNYQDYHQNTLSDKNIMSTYRKTTKYTYMYHVLKI